MSKKLTNKFLLFTIILVILASVLFINVLSNNNTAFADDEIEIPEYQEIHVEYYHSERVYGRNVLVDFSTAPNNFYFGYELIINDTVENITITDGDRYLYIYDAKIIIEPRTTDLTVNIDGMRFDGLSNETIVYNQSTKGTVYFVNTGSRPVSFTGDDRTDTGYFKDGIGISGIFYSKGNISFAGENGFIIDGGTAVEYTYWGNLQYGNTGLQVAAGKKVYVDTTLNVRGGDGLRGASIPGLVGRDGGHGGYAFDGPLANIIIGDEGFLTLKGGNGGDGAWQMGNSGPLGKGGNGCAAYYMSIKVNDSSRFSYEAGVKGADGYYRGY